MRPVAVSESKLFANSLLCAVSAEEYLLAMEGVVSLLPKHNILRNVVQLHQKSDDRVLMKLLGHGIATSAKSKLYSLELNS